jgi:hypothetical protein
MKISICRYNIRVMIRRSFVNSRLNNELILWVNPSKIDYYVGLNDYLVTKCNNLLGPVIFLKRPAQTFLSKFILSFVIPEKNYASLQPIQKHNKYKLAQDIITHRNNFRNSTWYQYKIKDLSERGFAIHKNIIMKNEKEIEDFFMNYILKIINSFETHGYLIDKGIGNVTIGSDGIIHKSNAGDHRFFMAKKLNLRRMPVKVKAVHEDWFMNQVAHEGISDKNSLLLKLSESLQNVESAHQ